MLSSFLLQNSIMEDLCERIPLIRDLIFKNVDNQSLINCRKASKRLNQLIDEDRKNWIRIILKYKSNSKHFEESWKKIICKTPTSIIKKLSIAVHKFFTSDEHFISIYFGLYQWSPLHIAAAIGDPELCNYIVQKTGDINPKDKNGITLLHTVAKNGQTEICKILLKYVQDVNPKTFNGRTPLHEAAQNGHLGLCNILINNGADVQTKDDSGFAPLDPISKFMERITYCVVMGLGICWASTLPYSVLYLRKAIWNFATFFD